MSGSFEDMLRSMQQVSASDISIELPDTESFEAQRERARRENEERLRAEERDREAAALAEQESREVQAEEQGGGELGGTAGSAAGQASAAQQAPDPVPQRDEPDEGEHASSAPEEPVSAPEPEPEEEEEPEPIDEPPAPAEPAQEDDGAEEPPDPSIRPEIGVGPGHATPVERDRAAVALRSHLLHDARWDRSLGFSFEGKNDPSPTKGPKGESDEDRKKREALPPSRTTQIKAFPRALVEALRRAAEPAYGSGELDDASAASLVTAFIVARTGIAPPGLDANTEGLARVFSSAEPHLVTLEDRLQDFHNDVQILARGIKLMDEKVRAAVDSAEATEAGVAYLLADRVDPIPTDGISASNIDLLDRRAQAAGRKARDVSRAERARRQYEDGRSL